MSNDIQITIPPALATALRSAPRDVVLPLVAMALDRQNELTVGATVAQRMSFPRTQRSTLEGLRVQTGRLRRSLSRGRARVLGDRVESTIGSNVRYFGVHEFGFQGTVNVRPHSRQKRQFQLGDNSIVDIAFIRRIGSLTRRGAVRGSANAVREVAARQIPVRGHTRQVNMPARRMVRRTLASRMPRYLRALQEAAAAALGGAS